MRFCTVKCASVFLLIASVAATVSAAYASSDAYDSGYDHGCDDAGISDPSDRYYNQPEKGPSFHTEAFNQGYDDGFDACSGGGSGGPDGDSNGSNQDGSINWEQLCLEYGNAIDIPPGDCSRYADGTQLTPEGTVYLIDKLKDAAETIGSLSWLLNFL